VATSSAAWGWKPNKRVQAPLEPATQLDFKKKIKICESETSETQYWLEVIVKLKWLSWAKVKWEYEECGELIGIFTSAANK